jgi:hypothetical protein
MKPSEFNTRDSAVVTKGRNLIFNNYIMKPSEFNTGDSVVVTSKRERVLVVKTEEQKANGEHSKFMIEQSSHTAKVVNKKFVTLKNVEGDNEEILFDGWVYFCDDGSAYYPGFEQGGEVHTLTLASELDNAMYN